MARKPRGVPLPPREQVEDTLTPEDVLEAAADVLADQPQPARGPSGDFPPDLAAEYAREARDAAAGANASLAADLRRIGPYLDALHGKQPREMLKRARAARWPAGDKTDWQEVRAFMRPLVAQGLPTDRIVAKAQERFGHLEKSGLLRRGLTGLRKELRKTGSPQKRHG